MKTIDEMNDEIRARVNAELPRPAGGFETFEAREAWLDAHEKRFKELCAESANAERIREAAPDLLAALEQCMKDCNSKEVIHPRSRYTLSMATQQMARAAIAKARGGSR